MMLGKQIDEQEKEREVRDKKVRAMDAIQQWRITPFVDEVGRWFPDFSCLDDHRAIELLSMFDPEEDGYVDAMTAILAALDHLEFALGE